MHDICKQEPAFTRMLKSPVLHTTKKREIISELFKDRFHPISFSFINLVIKNKRDALLIDMARNFMERFRTLKGIKRVTITTAVPFSNELKEKIKALLEKEQNNPIELYEKVNKSILGGYVVRVDDIQFDASLATQLYKTKQNMLSLSFEDIITEKIKENSLKNFNITHPRVELHLLKFRKS